MPSKGHAKRVQGWRRRYGITDADYQRMLAAQGGVCAICSRGPDTVDGLLHIDHDHMTGRVRALLCKKCNTALGNIQDNAEVVARMTKYLESHQTPPEASPLPPSAIEGLPKERPTEQRGQAYLTDKQLKDLRIPRPELLVAMEQAGMDKKQIAEELGISLRTAKAILSDKERIATLAYARDWLIRDVISTAITKVKMGVETDDKGEFSLDFLTKMGVFPKEQKEQAPIAQGFEEWRMSILRRTPPAIEAEIIDGESSESRETSLRPVSPSLLSEGGQDSGRE